MAYLYFLVKSDNAIVLFLYYKPLFRAFGLLVKKIHLAGTTAISTILI